MSKHVGSVVMKEYDSDVEADVVQADGGPAGTLEKKTSKEKPTSGTQKQNDDRTLQEKLWQGSLEEQKPPPSPGLAKLGEGGGESARNIESLEDQLFNSPRRGSKASAVAEKFLQKQEKLLQSEEPRSAKAGSVHRENRDEDEELDSLLGPCRDFDEEGNQVRMVAIPPKNYLSPNAMGSWFMIQPSLILGDAMFDDVSVEQMKQEAQHKLDQIIPEMDRLCEQMAKEQVLTHHHFHPAEHFFHEFGRKLEMGDSDDDIKLYHKQNAASVALQTLCLCVRYAYAGGEALAEKECPSIKAIILGLDQKGLDFVTGMRQLLTYVMSYGPMCDKDFVLHPLAKILFSLKQCLCFMETAQLVSMYLRCTAVLSLDEGLKDAVAIMRKLCAVDNLYDFFRPQAATFFFSAPFSVRTMITNSPQEPGRWAKMFGKDGCQTKVAAWTNAMKSLDFIKVMKEMYPDQFSGIHEGLEPYALQMETEADDAQAAQLVLAYDGKEKKSQELAVARSQEQEAGAAPMDMEVDASERRPSKRGEESEGSIEISIDMGENKKKFSIKLADHRQPPGECQEGKGAAPTLRGGEARAPSRERRNVTFDQQEAEYNFLLPARLAGKNYHQQALLLAGKGAAVNPKGNAREDLQKPVQKNSKKVPVGMQHQMQRLLMAGLHPYRAAKNKSAHPLEYDHSLVSSYDLREPLPGETSRVCRPKRANEGPFSNHHHLIADRGCERMLIHDGAKIDFTGPLLGQDRSKQQWPFNEEEDAKKSKASKSKPTKGKANEQGKGAFNLRNKHVPTPAEQQVKKRKDLLEGDREFADGDQFYYDPEDYADWWEQEELHEQWENEPGKMPKRTNWMSWDDWRKDPATGTWYRPGEEPGANKENQYYSGGFKSNQQCGQPHVGASSRAPDEDAIRAERIRRHEERQRLAREERELMEEAARQEELLREARRNLLNRDRDGGARRNHYAGRDRGRDAVLPDPFAGMTTLRTRVAPAMEEIPENLQRYLEEPEHGSHLAPATEDDLRIPQVLCPRVAFVYNDREKVLNPKLGRCFRHKIGTYFRARADEQTRENDFTTPPMECEYFFGISLRSTIIWLLNRFDSGKMEVAIDCVVVLTSQGLMEQKTIENMIDLFISGDKPKLDNGTFYPMGTSIKRECQECLEEIVSGAIASSGDVCIILRLPSRETYAKMRICTEKVKRDVLPVSSAHHLNPQTADPKNAQAMADQFTVCNILTMLTFSGGFWRGDVELQTTRYADFCNRNHGPEARLPALIGRKAKAKLILEFTDKVANYPNKNPMVGELISHMIQWLELVPDAGNKPLAILNGPTAPAAGAPSVPEGNPRKGGGKGKPDKFKNKGYYNTWGSGKYQQQQYRQQYYGNTFSYGSLPSQQQSYYQQQYPQQPQQYHQPNQHQHQQSHPPQNNGGNKRPREENPLEQAGGNKFKLGPDGQRAQGSFLVERHRNAIHAKTGVTPGEIQQCRGLCTYHLAARVGITDENGELVCCPAGDACKRDKGHKIANAFYDEKCKK